MKIKKQNVNRKAGHSGSVLSITVWRTIISCLCVWEIINFRKTKYVKFIPGASDYFCAFKAGSVECDDILKTICYLLISSHAFYLCSGLKRISNLYTNTLSVYSPGRKRQAETLAGMRTRSLIPPLSCVCVFNLPLQSQHHLSASLFVCVSSYAKAPCVAAIQCWGSYLQNVLVITYLIFTCSVLTSHYSYYFKITFTNGKLC